MEQEIDSAPCLYFCCTDDGVIRYVNKTLCETLGFTADLLIGHPVNNILSVSAKIFYNTHVFPMLRMSGRINEVFIFLQSASEKQVAALVNAMRVEGESPLNKFIC